MGERSGSSRQPSMTTLPLTHYSSPSPASPASACGLGFLAVAPQTPTYPSPYGLPCGPSRLAHHVHTECQPGLGVPHCWVDCFKGKKGVGVERILSRCPNGAQGQFNKALGAPPTVATAIRPSPLSCCIRAVSNSRAPVFRTLNN